MSDYRMDANQEIVLFPRGIFALHVLRPGARAQLLALCGSSLS